MDEFRLTTEQIRSLRVLHRRCKERRLADRIKAVVLLGSGWTVVDTAEALLLDEETVRSYRRAYQQGGTDLLLTVGYQGSDPIYFMDGVHPRHNPVAAYGWIKRGTDQTMESNTGRSRVNINGAVDIARMKVVV